MAVLIMCSEITCGELFDVPDETVGGPVRCPACGVVLLVDENGNLLQNNGSDSAVAPAQSDRSSLSRSDGLELWELDEAESRQGNGLGTSLDHSPTPKPNQEEAMPPLAETSPPEELAPPATLSTAEKPKTSVFDSMELGGLEAWNEESSPRGVLDDPPATEPAEGSLERDEGEPLLDLLPVDLLADPAADDDLNDSHLPILVPVIGMAGLIGGAILGAWWFPAHPWMAAWLGGFTGWAVAFIMPLLVILSIDRPAPEETGCGNCQAAIPAEAEACLVCGSPAPTTTMHPLVRESLAALSYAGRCKASVLAMVAVLTVASIVVVTFSLFTGRSDSNVEADQWALLAVAVFSGMAVFAHWMESLRRVIHQTLTVPAGTSPMAGMLSRTTWKTGFLGIALMALGLVPIITLPLAPLGMLLIGSSESRHSMGLAGMVRSVWRRPWNFVILWLMLLCWLAAMGFVLVMLGATLQKLGLLVPQDDELSYAILRGGLGLGALFLMGTPAALFSIAMARCIGLFGRYQFTRHD